MNKLQEITVSSTVGQFVDQIQEESSVTGNGGRKHKSKFHSFPNGLHGEGASMKLGTLGDFSPTSPILYRNAYENEELRTPSVPSPADHVPSGRFLLPFVRKINWDKIWKMWKEWIRNPLNMALFAWIFCVAVSGAILFLVMTGMLNAALPTKSERDTWFEINNQILNALFTLMCLYQHPKRFHHLVLLCRWRQNDILRLRMIYCKNGTPKPDERRHLFVVILLLHLNCFAQYALCGLNLGFPRSKRPAVGVGLCISVAIASPAIASVYNILSPLGRDYEVQEGEEEEETVQSSSIGSTPSHVRPKSSERRYSFMSREDVRVAVNRPEWVGGLFDFWDDIALAYLSLFCSCCVFGWNMERLGFGNMYVHVVTFLLFCLAPFFIFNLAAVNIDSEGVREALGLSGFLLCVFGLLYGGFWRVQMRKRFNLPATGFCGFRASAADFLRWLCCCSCALAQEVRTVDYYDVEENKFYFKRTAAGENEFILSPSPGIINSGPSSPFPLSSNLVLMRRENIKTPRSSSEYSTEWFVPPSTYTNNDQVQIMAPPLQFVIEKEHDKPAQ